MKKVNRWSRRCARNVQRGFTLLEIMIVLAIMGLIVTAVSIQVFKQLKKARISTAKIEVKKIADATARAMAGGGTGCPKGIDDLIAQGELSKNDTKDPWGTPFIYKCPGTDNPDGADVLSAGPDKQPGTEDDIKNAD
jgi:general secretion pathway protein G